MTQKELSYMEDAIGHEDNIIKIINESIKLVGDEKIVSFLEEEGKKHMELKEKLLTSLEDKANG